MIYQSMVFVFVVSDVGGGDYFEDKNKIPILGSHVSLIISY